ncbi:MAG: hypothetical protein V7K26_19530, partial [Nostoc sp.]|uniref:hypothetical protein n=1 Tax=Nostoc sp. TaxID=1180 RepID=UPI002FF4B7BC
SLSQRLNARLEAEPQRGAFPCSSWERDTPSGSFKRPFWLPPCGTGDLFQSQLPIATIGAQYAG